MGAKNSGGGGGILRGKPGGGGVMGKIGDEMMGAISSSGGCGGDGEPADPANPGGRNSGGGVDTDMAFRHGGQF